MKKHIGTGTKEGKVVEVYKDQDGGLSVETKV